MSILCSMVGASFTVAAAAEIIRYKNGISAHGGATISTTQSKFGGASLGFGDGASDYYKVYPNSTSYFGGSGDMTFEFWYWRATSGSGLHITDFRQTGVDGSSWTIVDFEDGRLGLRENGWLLATNFGMPTQTWTHVAIVKQGTTLKFYKNGTLTDTVTGAAATFSNRADCFIGANYADQSAGNNLNGYIDELRISSTARYTTNFTAPTAPFVNDNNTLLLIHGDGTNGSTFVEDDNGTGRSQAGMYSVNGPTISTTQSKFGGSSLYFPENSGQALYAVHNPQADGLTNNGDFTVELWAYFTKLPSSGDNGYMVFYGYSPEPYMLIQNGGVYLGAGGYPGFTGSSFTTNTWYHIAVSRASGSMKCFVNGTQYGSTVTGSTYNYIPYSNNLFTRFGKFTDDRGRWQGYMDEIRFSKTARYTANFTTPTAPFVNDANTLLLIHGDGTNSSTVFRDDNGVRAPKGIQALGNAQIDNAQSKFGGTSALFDGTGDYLVPSPNTDLAFGTGDFTIEFWLRVTSVSGIKVMYDSRPYPQNGAYPVIYLDGSTLIYFVSSASRITTTIAANTWYHIAVSRSGTSTKMFVDGTQVGSTFSDSTNYLTGTVIIGADHVPGGNGVVGHMDEIRISNTARYTANFTPSTTPFSNDINTLLLLHCDGTDGSTVFFDDNGQVPQTP